MREIVLGPPGTGKTTRLLRMVEEELEAGTPPDRIGYFSFTKKAAREAITRACEKFSLTDKDTSDLLFKMMKIRAKIRHGLL